MPQGAPDPGWYPSPDPKEAGRFARYWDGSSWTEHRTEIGQQSAKIEIVAEPDPTTPPPAPASAGERTAPSPGGAPRRRWTWVPRLIIATIAVLLVGVFILESLPASGPIGYSLIDRTTSANPLVRPPSVRVSSGTSDQVLDMRARQDGSLRRFSDVPWDRDEPLTIQILPRVAGDRGDLVTLDLRGGGATAFSQDWFLRIDVVAYDDRFDVTVLQPTLRGLRVTRFVAHEVSLPRAVRTIRPGSAGSTSEVTAEQREAAEQRRECERIVTSELRAAATPVLDLRARHLQAAQNRRLFDDGVVTWPDYRGMIQNLINDMRRDREQAEDALGELSRLAVQLGAGVSSLDDLSMLQSIIDSQEELSTAWASFRAALFNEQYRPGATFQDIYPIEASRIDEAYAELFFTTNTANGWLPGELRSFASATCLAQHPEP